MLFLANTASAGLVVSGQPNLLERGAAFLFLRYLYEQASSGNNFLAALLNTSKTGVDNLEAAFNGKSGFNKFHQLMARWTVALALTDASVTEDPRYVYKRRTIDAETGYWKGVCLRCSIDDNRGTVLDGVNMKIYDSNQTVKLLASTAKFYDMPTFPSNIRIIGNSNNGNFGVLIRQR